MTMENDKGTQVLTPVGRIVWGHPIKPSPILEQEGPNTGKPKLDEQGQPKYAYTFGVAFTRAEFEQHIWPAMWAEASKAFPNGVPQGFAWKYKDANAVDKKGKLYSEREGYAGCMVLTITSNLPNPPAAYVFVPATNSYRQIAANEVKTGDYVRVLTNFKVNVPKDVRYSPSLYVNPESVEFVGYGTEISNVPQINPNAVFGGQQVALPPGASAQPLAPTAQFGMPTAQPQPAMQQPQQMGGMPVQQAYAPAPVQQPAMQPQQAYVQPVMGQPQPAYDVVQQAGYNPQQPAPMMQQPQPQPQMMPGQPQPMGGMPQTGGMPMPGQFPR
jgi:hypothetical protein